MTNAARPALKARQPTRLISMKASSATMMGAPLPRSTEAQASRSPASTHGQVVGVRLVSSTATATRITKPNTASGRM